MYGFLLSLVTDVRGKEIPVPRECREAIADFLKIRSSFYTTVTLNTQTADGNKAEVRFIENKEVLDSALPQALAYLLRYHTQRRERVAA
ncbi:MAG: hypothetical protein WC757_03975 [Candidatus Paceibacterota bacterium]|jgi:hypothetical protein